MVLKTRGQAVEAGDLGVKEGQIRQTGIPPLMVTAFTVEKNLILSVSVRFQDYNITLDY